MRVDGRISDERVGGRGGNDATTIAIQNAQVPIDDAAVVDDRPGLVPSCRRGIVRRRRHRHRRRFRSGSRIRIVFRISVIDDGDVVASIATAPRRRTRLRTGPHGIAPCKMIVVVRHRRLSRLSSIIFVYSAEQRQPSLHGTVELASSFRNHSTCPLLLLLLLLFRLSLPLVLFECIVEWESGRGGGRRFVVVVVVVDILRSHHGNSVMVVTSTISTVKKSMLSVILHLLIIAIAGGYHYWTVGHPPRGIIFPHRTTITTRHPPTNPTTSSSLSRRGHLHQYGRRSHGLDVQRR
mmetsp:Transcript_13553/g.29266  ORF Transcript_13553/g.29266 Transcript_13553/m.29266 type:complete len:294 (-) Transcript_13553:655-1536(-)